MFLDKLSADKMTWQHKQQYHHLKVIKSKFDFSCFFKQKQVFK